MTLYYAFPSRAMKVRWLLEELNLPYQLTRFDLAKGDHLSDAYRQIHPLAKVPSLIDGQTTIYEAGAICIYLADRYRSIPLAPVIESPRRAEYLQWIFFSINSFETPFLDFFKNKNQKAKERFMEAAEVLAHQVRDKEYLFDDFSAADCMIGTPLGWARFTGILDEFPALLDYNRRLVARPASKRSRHD